MTAAVKRTVASSKVLPRFSYFVFYTISKTIKRHCVYVRNFTLHSPHDVDLFEIIDSFVQVKSCMYTENAQSKCVL